MHREEDAERYIKKGLWGYPVLMKRFLDDVRPALVEARDSRKVQSETGNTASDSRRLLSDLSESLTVALDSPGVAEILDHPDDQASPVLCDQMPPSVEHRLLAIAEDTEEPQLTPREPSLRLHILSEGERPHLHNENVEVLSTSENIYEGSRGKEVLGQ